MSKFYDIDANMTLRPPQSSTVANVMDCVRGDIIECARRIDANVPECPEKTLAFRKLEEAMFYAIGAVARNQPAVDAGLPS